MKLCLSLALFLSIHVGFAHADLASASPEQNAVLSEPPSEVVLTYTEAVEVRFSMFKVYALEVAGDLSEPQDRLRINAAAGALMSEALDAEDDTEEDAEEDTEGNAASRADTGVLTEARTSDMVTLALGTLESGALEPGFYVVMWRVLSVDTHTSTGSFVFEYDPNG